MLERSCSMRWTVHAARIAVGAAISLNLALTGSRKMNASSAKDSTITLAIDAISTRRGGRQPPQVRDQDEPGDKWKESEEGVEKRVSVANVPGTGYSFIRSNGNACCVRIHSGSDGTSSCAGGASTTLARPGIKAGVIDSPVWAVSRSPVTLNV